MRFISKIILFVFCITVYTNQISYSQCASLFITGPANGVVPCDSSLVLTANVAFPSGLKNTDDYTVAAIPFTPLPWIGANQIIANQDDVWSDTLHLPFPFCFYGNVYTKIIVSSNGQIGFDATLASTGNMWASNGWICPISNITLNNTIMGPYHDIYPAIGNPSINWDIFGIAPCRTMVVNFTSVPMFSCTTLIDTQQIVLHELTNEIDINIKNKPLCSTWNGGVAHEGIQNATGTAAVMAPGRNGTQWTAIDDAYKFSPNGANTPITYTFSWYDSTTNAFLGNGQVLTLPPPVMVTGVICVVNITGGCNPYSFSDTFHVDAGRVNADFFTKIHLGCDKDTVKFINTTTPSSGTTYSWDFGDNSPLVYVKNPTHIYGAHNQFTVTLIANHAPCIPDTIMKVIDLRHPIKASFESDSVCVGNPISLDAISSEPLGYLNYFWDLGNGDTHNAGGNSFYNSYIYPAPGNYTITLTVKDTLGCTDTVSHNAFVDAAPYVSFTASKDPVCVGEPIYFVDTMSSNTVHFLWDFADGSTFMDVHNPVHSWLNAGIYNVTLIGKYKICPDYPFTKNIVVEDYPSVNLGQDTSYCPGLTGTILLSNINSAVGTSLWNTNETTPSISVNSAGYYWLKVTNASGNCATTDSIWVKEDCYLNIPNSFSPNNDGKNDYFLPRDLLSSGLRSFKLTIFNRWGNEIYFTDKTEGRGWDGKFNNVEQPIGVYVYLIDAVFDNNVVKHFSGNVTLMR